MWTAASPLTATDKQKEQLMTWLRSGKTEQRVAFRCHIVLRAIGGESNNAIATGLQTSRPTVILWRDRFEKSGPEALREDLPRGRSFSALSQKKIEEVIEKTTQSIPTDATHWSCRSMAQASNIGKDSVQRIWDAHGLKPHLVKTFKLSNDKNFVEKLKDVVGLYLNPPENALVFRVIVTRNS